MPMLIPPGKYFRMANEMLHNISSEVFAYTRVKNINESVYILPFRIHIKSNSIDFKFSGFTSDETNYKITYLSYLIFSLNLEEKNWEKILGILFPKPNESKGINHHFVSLIDGRHYKKEKTNASISYSSLNCFSPKQKERIKFIGKQREFTKSFHLHEFFLDFLFDFFHSNFFKNNIPNYEQLKTKLTQNPFLNCILSKADFYYYYYQSKNFKGPFIQKKQFQRKFQDSFHQWLNILNSNSSRMIIHPDNNWFFSIEDEKEAIYSKAIS